MRPLLLAAGLATLYGCMPVSVTHYGSAKPLGKGNFTGGGGFMIPRDGGSGFNRGQATGDPVTTHHAASFVLDNWDLYGAYGITPTTDVSLKIWEVGVQAGAKQTLVNANTFKIAIGGYASAWAADYTSKSDGAVDKRISGQGTVLEFPLTFSAHPTDNVAVYAGPMVTRWDTRLHHFTQKTNGTDVYSVEGTRFYEGAFAGLCIGDELQFNMGSTFYRESTTYPQPDFGGDAWFAYPYVGLTGTFGKPKKPVAPAVSPRP